MKDEPTISEPDHAAMDAWLATETGKNALALYGHPGDYQAADPETSDDRATELANAEELHRLYGDKFRWNVDRGVFMFWTGTHWSEDHDGFVTRLAIRVAKMVSDRLRETCDQKELSKFVKSTESAKGIEGMLRLARSLPGISCTADRFNCDDYKLNLPNGTLMLKNGVELLAHNPNDLITKCISTPYRPDATCPLWLSVVARSMNYRQTLVDYLQRMFGAALTGTANVHELAILYGEGANGKSVIVDTLLGIMEGYAGVAPESLLIARNGSSEHPTELADMLGKRLVVASETESNATLRLQLVKRLTGDAKIKARFMRQDFFEIRRTWKIWLVTNNRPRLSENTEAVWRRLRLLPFDVIIPAHDRDQHLTEKLKAEWPGILKWAVDGCVQWQRDGMNPPAEVLVATDDYRQDADELAEFISTKCIAGDQETFRVGRTELYAAYVAWAKASNERHPLDRNPFYEAIRRRDGIGESKWKVSGSKIPIRGFTGISLAVTEEGSSHDYQIP